MALAVRVVCIALFGLVSLELGLRGRIAFQSHHVHEADGLFRYAANTQVGGDPALRTNGLGFFGEDMVIPKPEGQLRVVVMGSSAVTSPVLATTLQQYLETATGRDVIVNTVGIPRYTSYHNALLAERYLQDLGIDIAIFYGGMNDNVYNTFPEFAPIPYDGFIDAGNFSRSVIFGMAYDKGYLKKVVAVRAFTPEASAAQLKANLGRIADAIEGTVVLVPLVAGWPTQDEALANVIHANEGPMSHFWGTRDSALAGLAAHREVMKKMTDVRGDVAFAEVDDALQRDSATFHDLCHLTERGIHALSGALGAVVVSHVEAADGE